MGEFTAISLSAVVVALALLAEHLALWQQPWRLNRPAAYTVGTITIGLGVTLCAWLLDDWRSAIVFWGATIPGGVVVVVAYWLRGALHHTDEAAGVRNDIRRMVFSEHAEGDADGTSRKSRSRWN